MGVVVFHPAKGALTSSETKTASDRFPGEDQRALPGHYWADPEGVNSPVYTGPESRTKAVLWGVKLAQLRADRRGKNIWRKAGRRWVMTRDVPVTLARTVNGTTVQGMGGYTYKSFASEHLTLAICATVGTVNELR